MGTEKYEDGFTAEDFELAVRTNDMEIDTTFSGEGRFKAAIRRYKSNKAAMFGLITLILLVLSSIIIPLLSGRGINEQNPDRSFVAPKIPGILSGSEKIPFTTGERIVNKYEELSIDDTIYLFGTDQLGRDLFSRCFKGMQVSLLIALAAGAISLIIGMNYGMISGYIGGKTDMIMQQIVDVLSSIPSLVVVTLLMLVFKPGISSIIIAIMLTGWMEMSIIARAQVFRLKDREYILAARTLGAGNFFILFREILPNIFEALVTELMVSIPTAIFFETFLSFVGLGLPVGACSLGRLIADGFDNCLIHPYTLIPPMILLVLLMISANLVAEGLKDAFE
ncbi:ABC transporter permease [Butyrivibrio sp. AE3004]|uniref:ABC transporter permease n=1 Tax=Butyrivibrio sp. AE3004 TaxID=1506994 RepID=UPI000493EAAE|nr:ABC transporter permease [Butyrivibrio sp. AE3004]